MSERFGIVDTLTGGATKSAREWVGLDGLVDTESGLYEDGTTAGMVADFAINVGLTAVTAGAGGAVAWAKWVPYIYHGGKAVTDVVNTIEAVRRGEWKEAVPDQILSALVSKLTPAPPFVGPDAA